MVAVTTVSAQGAAMNRRKRSGGGNKPRERGRRQKDSFEKEDQIWAAFDRDAHPDFDYAAALCERRGVEVGRSDPCSEPCLILHQGDHDKRCDSPGARRELAHLRPEYAKDDAKTPDCDDLAHHVAEAERRAEAQLRRSEEEGAPCGNPSTAVGRLTRAIREADERARPPAG